MLSSSTACLAQDQVCLEKCQRGRSGTLDSHSIHSYWRVQIFSGRFQLSSTPPKFSVVGWCSSAASVARTRRHFCETENQQNNIVQIQLSFVLLLGAVPVSWLSWFCASSSTDLGKEGKGEQNGGWVCSPPKPMGSGSPQLHRLHHLRCPASYLCSRYSTKGYASPFLVRPCYSPSSCPVGTTIRKAVLFFRRDNGWQCWFFPMS